ncbi:GDP-4-keto-6-deoxy-D-mannose-3-dehydratase / pyridoxamine-phosphate transaminase, partial [termite gut metagenome]
MSKVDLLKQQILELTKEYYKKVHGGDKVFEKGKTFINYGGRYFDEKELVNLVDSSLDFWLTAGSWAKRFESR